MKSNTGLDDLDALLSEILRDPVAGAAARENDLRCALAAAFEDARRRKGWSVRQFGDALGTSKTQVQRLLNKEKGGSLTLYSIVRAALAVDLDVVLSVAPHLGQNVVHLDDWKAEKSIDSTTTRPRTSAQHTSMSSYESDLMAEGG